MVDIKIAPSLLACDFACLKEELKKVESAGCDMFHLDVMDGHFVPNITFGPLLAKTIHRITDIPLDVHLMIEDPGSYWRQFKDAGAEMISFHIEALELPGELIDEMKKANITVGLALNPKTPVDEILPYIKRVDFILVMTVVPGFGGQQFMEEPLKKVRKLKDIGLTVEIDGGIKISNAKRVIESGADILVSGTGIFGEPDPALAIKKLRVGI
ncbi:ribulose-phosphate 3-epimerase [candidate division WOR-3 bacterium]|nr:ribulose-phosphate 3-epimerase [candidate division WOR-3 bacterium]